MYVGPRWTKALRSRRESPARERPWSPLRRSRRYQPPSASPSNAPVVMTRAPGGMRRRRTRVGTSAAVAARRRSMPRRHGIDAGSTTHGPSSLNAPMERSVGGTTPEATGPVATCGPARVAGGSARLSVVGSERDTKLQVGSFSAWLDEVLEAIDVEATSNVPCGACTACCRSSQFVRVAPDELDTLAHIPAVLQAPAPGRPPGWVVLRYDERGHCPMLVDDRCSIYEHRPRTCRVYDCRVFAATGVDPGDYKLPIQRQVRRWEFEFPTDGDRIDYEAVQAAAADTPFDPNPTQQAVEILDLMRKRRSG